MKQYQLYNNITGWVIFAFALLVYTLTLEPTASFWDAGEFILSAYKLEIVHPPGSPLFAIVGRIFTLFAGDPANVAFSINFFSGLVSAFTVLFVFWSITHFARRLMIRTGEEFTTGKMIAVLGAGVIGGASATFVDSFWFSAVEGEVYAFSAFFTLLAFWAMLKWESVADHTWSDRWIVFIAFVIGLSIGVHLLALLAIPALAFIYYFRKYEATPKGVIVAFFIGFGLLAFVLWGVLDYFVKIGAHFDKFFVNSMGLPFNIGFLFFIMVVFGICFYFIYFARKRRKYWLQTALLSFLMLIMGISSYSMVIIRSSANTPINMNDPSDAFTLYSYLKREQYGSRPLVYGPYFTARPMGYIPKGSLYGREGDKYIEIGKKTDYDFDVPVQRFRSMGAPEENIRELQEQNKQVLFPRMGSLEGRHTQLYRDWVGLGPNEFPTYGDNLKYFFNYQLGYMYWRYFLWNFSGRQDDLQGFIDKKHGNWITGIKPIDKALVGPALSLPASENSDARNKFYMLPLILGLIGVIYHFKRDKQMAWVVFMFFLFTGLMNIINSNQPPVEPRERDYAVAISFLAYAMWIGIGVMAIFEYIKGKLSERTGAIAASAVCLIVPVIMGVEGWDDHDRSDRYLARDSAINYLAGLAPNAIVFTQGDNDTYPLWYVQEVENFRTDIRVVNLSLLAVDWYIDQLHNKINDAPPVKLTFSEDDYRGDKLMQLPIQERQQGGATIERVMQFIKSNDPRSTIPSPYSEGQSTKFLPTRTLKIPVNKERVLTTGAVPEEYGDQVPSEVVIQLPEGKETLMRDELIIMDLIANNAWDRPIYFAITVDSRKYLGLDKYMQREGLAYRLVPAEVTQQGPYTNSDLMYENIMTNWKWGGLDEYDVYLDETALRTAKMMRSNLIYLAQVLMSEGKNEKAIEILDLSREKFPERNVPYTEVSEVYPLVNMYFQMDQIEKADELVKDQFIDIIGDEINYYYKAGNVEQYRSAMGGSRDFVISYFGRPQDQVPYSIREILQNISYLNSVIDIAQSKERTDLARQYRDRIRQIEDKLNIALLDPKFSDL